MDIVTNPRDEFCFTHSSGKNLFILGNGFDLAHNLPTQYSCFRNYLLSHSIQSKEDRDNMIIPKQMGPQIWLTKEDEIKPSPPTEFYADVVRWLVDDAAGKRHRMDWCDFESYLGKLRFEEVLQHWTYVDDDNSAYNSLREAVDSIKGFVSNWINTIELSTARPREKYKDVIDAERDYAITFNYTETLEVLYGMKQDHVCHIHGKRETDPKLAEKKKNLPIGDNNCEIIVGTKERKKGENKDRYTALRGSLVKDTKYHEEDHKDFFDLICDYQVNDIYSIGFSFSEVDNPYIETIISLYNNIKGTKCMTWHLSTYENLLKRAKYRRLIRKAGFKGRIIVG